MNFDPKYKDVETNLMHVYSRLPLAESKVDYLVAPDIPSMHTLLTLPSGDKIRHHFLHPTPLSPTENDESSF
jgi:hypothetical protein